jgi:radical SAM-linked protein
MQRIVCRYRKEIDAGALSFAEVRKALQAAARDAGLPLADDRRGVVMGPPLPPGATSDDERVLFELSEPRDPSEVRRAVNEHLPAGLHIEAAWIAQPGSPDENPAGLDAAVYDVCWQDPPPFSELAARLREFFAAAEVPLVRIREKKTQRLNVRALVRDLRVLDGRMKPACLQMTLEIGPQGSLKPEEVLQALGYSPAPGTVRVHRVALLSFSRRASRLALAAQRRSQG